MFFSSELWNQEKRMLRFQNSVALEGGKITTYI